MSTNHRRRDKSAPPSSRRGAGRGYRFEVAAALIRNYRMEPEEAFALVRRWGRLVDMRMQERRSSISTAEHIERFQRQRIVSPFPARTARDKRSGARAVKGRGQTRVSRRGIPFRLCAPGTEVQTLIFGPDVTPGQATRWATRHGYLARKVDVTSQSVRVRQRPPSVFQPGSFRTFVLSRKDDVRAVIGCPKRGKEGDKRKGGPGRPGSRRSRLTRRDPNKLDPSAGPWFHVEFENEGAAQRFVKAVVKRFGYQAVRERTIVTTNAERWQIKEVLESSNLWKHRKFVREAGT